MENPHDLMRAAVAQARQVNSAADNSANAMAELLIGRLQHVSGHNLAKLKAQLKPFNMQTQRWRNPK